jgi:hypothetical protein
MSKIKTKQDLIDTIRQMQTISVEMDELVHQLNSQIFLLENEVDTLTKENAQLKYQVAFEQRQNQRHANKQH